MADTITKSVAARLPMDAYIRVITTAAELKMTTSDFLIMKIHAQDERAILQQELTKYKNAWSQEQQQGGHLKKQIEQLNSQVNALQLDADTVKEDLKLYIRETDKLNKEETKWKERAESWEKEISVFQKKCKELEAHNNQLIVAQKRHQADISVSEIKFNNFISAMKKMRSALKETHNNSKNGAMSQSCWNIINEYIPG